LTGILNSDYFSYDGKNQLKSASLSGEESLTGAKIVTPVFLVGNQPLKFDL